MTYTLEPYAGGTRFTYGHTGFSGIGRFVEAQLLGTLRRKMVGVGLPPVLAELARSEPGATVSVEERKWPGPRARPADASE